ncbi:glutathione hydrolase 1 proenzyme-like [Liolophura sinensis]|uniref:glutathione hydrolase 1 proenzyme-like n=1 Tax=Liolophura sinensis TaxID=3198878 RepID=UPI00315907A4
MTSKESYELASTGQENGMKVASYGSSRHKVSKLISCAIFLGAVIIAIGLAIGIAIGLSNRDYTDRQINTDGNKPLFSSQLGRYRYASVASDATICSDIGTDILARKRGSAVDAAIASLFCMGAVNMHSMGIGGGFFATIYDSETKMVKVMDAREAAPWRANETMYNGNKDKALFGALAIGIPGEVKGYWQMHREYGKLPWSDLIQPTIQLCERGIPVTPALSRAIDRLVEMDALSDDLSQMLTNPVTGLLVKEGDVVKRPRFTRTLRILAQETGEGFYHGGLATDIAHDILDRGGIITERDLEMYKAKWKAPLTFGMKDGSILYSPPAPSSGAVLSLILSILEGYGFSNDSLGTEEKTILTYHRIAEAMKFAYAKRTNLGDSDFVDVDELVKNMTTPEYGESLRKQISDHTTFDPLHYGPTFHDDMKTGTAHLSLMDVDGNAVSVTSTINLYFGSGVVGKRTGIIFNDEMDDFSMPNIINAFGIKPSPANFIYPFKRPMSSMCPAIIVKGDKSVRMVTGAAGGSKITTAAALVVLRALRFDQDLKTATDSPRFHHQLLPNELMVEENGFSEVILEGLKAKGHVITTSNPRGSVAQTILTNSTDILGISDDRKSAKASGY